MAIIVSIISLLLVPFILGDVEDTFLHCCQLGTSIAAQYLKCDEAMSGKPVQGIAAEQQSLCLSMVQLCCARTLRDIQCKEGRMVATKGSSCHTTKHDESKYCCEACKLGMISGSMTTECQFKVFSMGEMWDESFQTCCTSIAGHDTPPTQIPLPTSPTTTVSRVNDEQSEANICDLLKGELCAHICVPVGSTSYRCQCEPGFTLMADEKSCHQNSVLNRCAMNNPCQHSCTDTGIAVECSCNMGYLLHSDNKSCVDVDECNVGLHDCTPDQTCHNEPGSFSCQTIPQTSSSSRSTLVTESSTNSHITDITQPSDSPQPITNNNNTRNEGTRCPHGYTFNPSTQLCKDVDECERRLHICADEETCVNMPGGYLCSPKQQQKCHPGLKYSQEKKNCTDINECEEGESPCDSNQICKNSVGSYSCQCKPGFQLDTITQACVDVNECQMDLHNCYLSQRCDNTIGSFQCVRYINCGSGYTLNAQTGLCEDNDECALNLCDHLGPGYKCRNILGSFRCDNTVSATTTIKPCDKCATALIQTGTTVSHSIFKCPNGFYLGPNRQCLDVNECEREVCRSNQVCLNVPGGYVCTNRPNCDPGMRLNMQTNRCVDIDECEEQPGICSHSCLNTRGSFICICQPGFTLYQDNRTCMDINECEMFKTRRLCVGYCVNQPGSYSCQCPQGYRLGIDGYSCQDIDECSSSNICTGKDEVCLNTKGAYRCITSVCPPDYVKDSQHQTRCKRINMSCREGDTECLQKPLTYSFHYITMVSNLTQSTGPMDLFMMRGPNWSSTNVEFQLRLEKVHCPHTVPPATMDHFFLQHTDHNVAHIRLLQPVTGPQDIFLQLVMKYYYNGIYGGTSISNIAIYVSSYDF